MIITKDILKIFAFTSISLIISMTGGSLNFIAIDSNNGAMPVLSNYYFYSGTHFSFQKNNEVNNPLLTDRFLLFHEYFSIGDFLILFGFLMFVMVCIFVGINYQKTQHDKNNN